MMRSKCQCLWRLIGFWESAASGSRTWHRKFGTGSSRPQTGYYNTLSLQAAALLQSLTQNHAFIDGNKRVAFASTAIFLRMNGFRLKVDADNGESFLIDQVIKKKITIEAISEWLEKHMKKVN